MMNIWIYFSKHVLKITYQTWQPYGGRVHTQHTPLITHCTWIQFVFLHCTFRLYITTNLPYKITLLLYLVETVSTWTCVEEYEKNINKKCSAQKKSNNYSMLCWMLPNKVWISCAFAFFLSEFGQFWVCFYQKWLKMQKKDDNFF